MVVVTVLKTEEFPQFQFFVMVVHLSLRVPVPLFALAADVMCDVVGAAKRRRDRQLRAFHRTVDGPPLQRSTPEVKSGGRAE